MNQTNYTSMKGKMVSLVAGIILLAIIFFPNKSFAFESSIEWQLVFVSDGRACSNYDYQMTNTYHAVTSEYMKVYNFANVPKKPICMNQYKIEDYQPDNTVDLLIIVYGRDVGRDFLNRYQVGGLYHHIGSDMSKNHLIVMCDCPNFQFSDPIWILSHELSHFILYYKGYGPNVVEDWVHGIDNNYDRCIQNKLTKLCKGSLYPLFIDARAYTYQVIPPYPDAIKDKPVKKSDSVGSLRAMITKMWAGGSIKDSDYLKLMGYDINSKSKGFSSGYLDKSKRFFTDGPTSEGNDLNTHNGDSFLTDKQVDVVLSHVPKSFLSPPSSKSIKDVKIPDWFKQTGELWAKKKITDEEYYDSLDYIIKKIKRDSVIVDSIK